MSCCSFSDHERAWLGDTHDALKSIHCEFMGIEERQNPMNNSSKATSNTALGQSPDLLDFSVNGFENHAQNSLDR
jgi:hypothetical protein